MPPNANTCAHAGLLCSHYIRVVNKQWYEGDCVSVAVFTSCTMNEIEGVCEGLLYIRERNGGETGRRP